MKSAIVAFAALALYGTAQGQMSSQMPKGNKRVALQKKITLDIELARTGDNGTFWDSMNLLFDICESELLETPSGDCREKIRAELHHEVPEELGKIDVLASVAQMERRKLETVNQGKLDQQRHDDEIRRQQCEADGGSWGNVVQIKTDRYVLLPVERFLGPCLMPKQETKAQPATEKISVTSTGCTDCIISDNTFEHSVPAPFDLPAKEWDEWQPPLPKNWEQQSNDLMSTCSASGNEDLSKLLCVDGVIHVCHQRNTCKDIAPDWKQRVLLETADGKHHCYALYQLERP